MSVYIYWYFNLLSEHRKSIKTRNEVKKSLLSSNNEFLIYRSSITFLLYGRKTKWDFLGNLQDDFRIRGARNSFPSGKYFPQEWNLTYECKRLPNNYIFKSDMIGFFQTSFSNIHQDFWKYILVLNSEKSNISFRQNRMPQNRNNVYIFTE